MTTKAQITIGAKDEASGVLGRIQRELAQVESVSVATSAALSGLTAGALGALSVGGLLAYAKAVTDGVDALNDLADATGTSIENASALEDVARRAGHSFENVTATLIKFNDVLNKAEPNSDTARTLEALGLSVKELQALDPAEALRQTAVAFTSFSGEGEKARAAQTLFGRSIKDVAPFLKDLAEQTQLVGTVTKAAADDADRFNKNLASLQKDALDASRSLSGPLVSSLNSAISAFKGSEGAIYGVSAALAAFFGGNDRYRNDKRLVELTEQQLDLQNKLSAARGLGIFGSGKAKNIEGELARVNAELATTLSYRKVLQVEDDKIAAKTEEDAKKKPLQIKAAAKAKAEEKSAYEAVMKALQEQIAMQDEVLLLGRELTSEEKFLLKIRAQAAASAVAFTADQEAATESAIRQIQEKSRASEQQARNEKVQAEASAVYAKDYEDEQKAIAEVTQRRADADRRAGVEVAKMLEQMRFENSLIGLSNADRELAIKLRDLEALGIRRQSAEYETLGKEIAKSLDVKRVAEAAKKEYEDVAAVALDLFKGNGDAAKRYVQQIIDEFVKLRVIEPILKDIFGITPQSGFDPFGMGSRKGSGFASGFPGLTEPIFANFDPFNLISFDGGGHTGNGSRSGGLDGKGGFMAMLHPKETVTDLTKGGGMGGNTFSTSIVIQGGGSDTVALERKFARALDARDEQWSRQLNAAKVFG